MKLVWIIIPLILFSVVGMSESFGETIQWSVQFGTNSSDSVGDITIDSLDNVYVAGSTNGDLFGTNEGESDIFIVKYDADGNELWTKQFGSSMNDLGTGITIYSLDNVYVTGYTEGDLFGTSAGIQDVFIVKYKSQIITSNFFENILKFFKTLFD